MAPERWHEIERLYHSALNRAPDQRVAFLDQASGGDEDLRREVESLLHQSAEGVLDEPLWQNRDDSSLQPGTQLGPYRILARLGAGGMGAVYKARDARLNRTVAIKVSSMRFSGRFEREAHAIAALNHPHICTLYDIGPNYLVMELVDGHPLKGPLPVQDALRYAVQIAEALDAAHRKDIVHRDLKPANILVTKAGIKLLDFGLAKMAVAPSDETQTCLTGEGTILGTLHYMSPEQVQGKDAGPRSDIFSFGAVLYEMLTGRRAFGGENMASVVSAILTTDPPPPRTLDSQIPAALDWVVRRCLAKDPDDRWQTARDLQAELRWILEGSPAEAAAVPQRPRWIGIAIGCALLAAVGTFWLARRPAAPLPYRKLMVASGESVDSPSISPDGKKIAFVSGAKLYIRDLSQINPVEVSDSDGASATFWSPDNQWAGYTGRNEIRKTGAGGGPSQLVCTTSGTVQGVAWTNAWDPHGVIVFAVNADGIFSVSANGGETVRILDSSATKTYDFHGIVFIGPGGDFLTWTHVDPYGDGHWIRVSKQGKAFRDAGTGTTGKGGGAWSGAGFLLTADVSGLPRGATSGPVQAMPMSAAGGVGGGGTLIDRLGKMPSLGADESLVYLRIDKGHDQLAIVDRAGGVLRDLGQPMPAADNIAVSSDNRHIAFQSGHSLWIYDTSADTTMRLINDVINADAPRWSADGKLLGFIGRRAGIDGAHLYIQRADSSSAPEASVAVPGPDWDWSRDMDKVVYAAQKRGNQVDIFAVTRSSGAIEDIVNTPSSEFQPEIDPSGRFLAYQSDETGRLEIYVRTFPSGGGKWQASTEGGQSPRWSPRGDELFYVAGENLMSLKVSATGAFRIEGRPVKLFSNETGRRFKMQSFAPMPDGRRFVIPRPVGDQSRSIILMENWQAELNRK